MVAGGNMNYVCESCKCVFIGWASRNRRFCSMKCSGKATGDRFRKHGESNTRLHNIWCQMKNRCTCETSNVFHYYGARGIRVCDEWMNCFDAFKSWAECNGYEPSLELDRINVNGNYEPENCRWATRRQQMANTRKRCDGKSSRFKGVSWNPIGSNWKAQVCHSGSNRYIGVYRSALLAALAYDDAAHVVHDGFAYLNFPERKRSLVIGKE